MSLGTWSLNINWESMNCKYEAAACILFFLILLENTGINHKCLTIFSHFRYEPKKTVQCLRKRWPLNVDCVAHQCRLLCCIADADGVWYRVCRHHLQCTGYKTKRVVSKVDQRGLFLLYSYITVLRKICATLYIPRSWPLLSSCQPQSTHIRLHIQHTFEGQKAAISSTSQR